MNPKIKFRECIASKKNSEGVSICNFCSIELADKKSSHYYWKHMVVCKPSDKFFNKDEFINKMISFYHKQFFSWTGLTRKNYTKKEEKYK